MIMDLNFDFDDYCIVRSYMNRSFRVKVDSRLVGFSGLVLSLGYLRASHFVRKALHYAASRCPDVLRFRSLGTTISFYVK